MKLNIVLILILFTSNALTAQDKKERVAFQTGEIVILKTDKRFDDDYAKSSRPYEESIIGVATGNSNPVKKGDLVIKEGIVEIKVTDENGIIKKGDLITSSSMQGTGMKATQSGMTIGIAMEDATAGASMIKSRILIQFVKQ